MSFRILLAVGVLSLGSFVSLLGATPVSAAYSSRNLIDDSIFVKKSTMSASQIQSFLKQKGSGLANKSWNDRSAARIIYDASQDWGINPQVILATLQKEQSLITDPSPDSIQLRSAMGYGCPDSAACSTEYKGFTYQVNNGTWQLRFNYERASGNPNWYSNSSYACYGPKNFYSNHLLPGKRVTFYRNTAINGTVNKTVTIANAATASLYCYTPHAGPYWETGYSGSYNFVTSFESWFGSVHSSVKFKSMKVPRWMEIRVDTRKLNPFTKDPVDGTLSSGMRIYFEDVVVSQGKSYLRTRHDSNNRLNKAIPLDALREISLEYTSLKSPRWMSSTKEIQKIDPITEKPLGSKIPAGTLMYFPTMTSFGGKLYIRSEADTHHNGRNGIVYDAASFENTTPQYTSLLKPRWFMLEDDTRVYNLKYPSGSTSPIIKAGTKSYFDHVVTINGNRYVTDGTPDEGYTIGTPLDDMRSINIRDFKSLKHQRAYAPEEEVQKTNLSTGKPADEGSVGSNQAVYFQTLIKLGDKFYLRSAHDTEFAKTTVIPLDELTPVDVPFESMEEPRRMRIKTDTKKIDPVTLQKLDTVIKKGRTVSFSQKISVDGKLYLRTSHDIDYGHFKAIPLSALDEL